MLDWLIRKVDRITNVVFAILLTVILLLTVMFVVIMLLLMQLI